MIFRLIIILFLIFPFAVDAQLQMDSKQVNELAKRLPKSPVEKINTIESTISIPSKSDNLSNSKSILYHKNISAIPAYAPRHYGVFCRIESKIEKKSNISPRFRLGSSAYVDMLEGKLD